MSEGLKEKCAIAGALMHSEDLDAAWEVRESLFAQQHRGAEGTGIAAESSSTNKLEEQRKPGMVKDAYGRKAMAKLAGPVAIGHNRYSTDGDKDEDHLQPFVDESIGLAFSMNGNIPDTTLLETFLSGRGIKTGQFIDSEMIGLTIAQHIEMGMDLPTAIQRSYPFMTGAFSGVAMHDGLMVAFRDQFGIRPYALGKTNEGDVMLASETCGLDIVDAKYVREIDPGEMLIISGHSNPESIQLAEANFKLDIFEFIYFARLDSYLYGERLKQIRKRIGERLATEHVPWPENHSNTVVVPIPDTSVPAAEGYAKSLGIESTEAVIKNRYIGRTFMEKTHNERQRGLKRKHNLITEDVRGKDVIFIDDSIVRLNTAPILVGMAHAAGARTVAMLIASPPVRFPDFYGIDTPDQSQLAAANMTIEDMAGRLSNGDRTYLGFISLEGLINSIGLAPGELNLSCFTGEYPIDIGKRKADLYSPAVKKI